jgi:glutamine amidotransferase-like uncharacterized protein
MTGSLAVTGGADFDSVTLTNTGISGAVKLVLKDGGSAVSLNGGGITKNLVVTGGADFDSVTFTNTGISGAVKLVLKDGGSAV